MVEEAQDQEKQDRTAYTDEGTEDAAAGPLPGFQPNGLGQEMPTEGAHHAHDAREEEAHVFSLRKDEAGHEPDDDAQDEFPDQMEHLQPPHVGDDCSKIYRNPPNGFLHFLRSPPVRTTRMEALDVPNPGFAEDLSMTQGSWNGNIRYVQ